MFGDDSYMTPEQAAAYRGCSTSYQARERKDGRGPRFIRIGRNIRYRKSDIDAFFSSEHPEAACA